MRVEIGWSLRGYTEIELSEDEIEIAVNRGAQPDDAYSIIEALNRHEPEWFAIDHELVLVRESEAFVPEFVSAVELTEEEA